MPLAGWRRMDALAVRPRRRRPGRMRRAVLVSLLIHLMIGVLLVVTIRRKRGPELLPPPSEVTMLFDTGRKNGPTLPTPDLQPTPSAPVAPAVPEPPLPEPALPGPSVPPPPGLVAPAPPAPAQPAAPSVEVPPPAAPTVEKAPVLPPPSRPSQAVRPSPPRPQAVPKAPDFPAPMDFSFGKPLVAPPSRAAPRTAMHIPGTIDMSLGPASRGAADLTPRSEHDEEVEGANWLNALSRWVADHAYYPEQARRDDEEGDARVHVVAEPDGRVKLVELVGKSGSMWLDLALLALFRDQHIPPLPYGEKEPIDFDFTMHYVLIRPR